ncbi:histidine kinase [Aquimarina sp. 2201CG5-10]|uniref:tetratricopeptide repeat-containing sensor histidine kinase n=1 Tax=Aquimarina callyspongiae TaxID=3098150 RepID=UPI002AB56F87|nr:histidine kinase [Aquimarina sp. 2201CG5-10]MDY8136715.1 histidine kinase [Aquimarina sp. 2201CG5-10]
MRIPYPIFLILLVVLLCCACHKTDSENDLLNKITDVDDLHSLAKNTVNDSTLVYIAAARFIIDNDKRLPDTLLIENLFRKGYYYKKIEQFDSAMFYFHKTIDLVKGPNTRKRNLAYFWNAWQTDEDNNRLANAVSAAQKFVEISKGKEHIPDLVFAYNFLERINLDLGDFDKSLYYNSKTLEAAKQSSDIDMYVITGSEKAKILYRHQKKKKEAFALLDSLSTIDCGKDAKRQLYRMNGNLHFYEQNYTEVLKYYKTVLELSKEIKEYHNYNLLESYNNLTLTYLTTEEYDIAGKYLDSTKAIITPNSDADYVAKYHRYRFRHNYRTKKNEDELITEYDNLLEESRKQHQKKIDEELFALKSANEKEKIAIAAKNESELKNIKLIALLIFSGLLLLIGYLLYRQRRYRFHKQEIQIQQRLLRAQMNPHFTFNTLSVIQNQIEENQEGAVDYLLRFSRLLRLILENSIHNYVQIENELELLGKYMDLQLLRFPDKFEYNISLENFEEENLMFIPPMLIQPFVENSIEHGFLGIQHKGQIDITLRLQSKYVHCTIEDNGVGLDTTNKGYKNSVSVKLISKFVYKTTKQKISILNKKDSNVNKSGVLVEFLIPYKFSEND